MANILMNQTPRLIAEGDLDLETDTLKIMLCTSTYVPTKDDTFVDDGSADDPASGEITATNYTGGFGGAGRKTLGSKAVAQDDANDRVTFDAANPTWTTLGGAANATIAWAVLIKEGTTDGDSLVLAAYEIVGGQLTNGSDFTLTIDALGLLVFRQGAAA